MEHCTGSCASEAAMDAEEGVVPSDEFTPREYQVELFEAARKENIIVCLGTGTGKTFIAVMLIKEYDAAVRIPFEEGGKRTFFLVPTVPLVVQQQKAIKGQTDLRVGGYVGDMGVDNWSAEHWNTEFVQSQVLVMTPDVFRLIIQHGFLALSRVNLLVLDECHRAVKQHTYREVMRCMDLVPPANRPRILGLTASVLNSKTKEREVERRIRDLEAALGARVLTVANQQSMSRYGTKPKEVLVEYLAQESSPGSGSVELPRAVRVRGTTLQGQELDRRQGSLAGVLLNLGPWCASLAASIVMDEADRLLDGQNDTEALCEVEASLEWFDEARKQLKHCIDQATSSFAACPPEEHPLLALASPKLRRLLEILWSFRPGSSTRPPQALPLCGIVFVKERIVARVLSHWLREVADNVPRFCYLKPCFIVGHGGSFQLGSKEAGMSFKKQCKVLRQFCLQEHNLLVATSVVEEGMDVPKCNLVVRFDFPDDFRSYVQSKGRARHHHSLYAMMAASNDFPLACANLRDYLAVEAMLLNRCHERRAPLESEVVLSFAGDELLPPYMPVRKDGAPRITLTSAIALVNRYCLVLPSDMFTRLKPTYELSCQLVDGKEKFVCTIYLPMASPLKAPIQGKAMDTKKQAKMAAALETCKRLHEIGEFDSSLLPMKPMQRVLEDFDEEEEADDAPPGTAKAGTKKRRRPYPKRVCELFSEARPTGAGQYHLHVITTKLVRLASEIQNWRQEKLPDPEECPLWFALVLRKDMPSLPKFPIFTRSGEELVSVGMAGWVGLSEEQCSLLRCFHRLLWDEVLRMRSRRLLSFDADTAPNSVLLAPVILDDSAAAVIDWSLVKTTLAGSVAQPGGEGGYRFVEHLFSDAVVVPHYAHPSQPYNSFYVHKVRRDLDVSHVEGKTSLREFLAARHGLTVTDPSQPLLEVSYTEKRMNLLTPRHRNRKGDKFFKKSVANRRVEYRVPEFCDIHPIPAGLWRKAVCLPSILYRLNQLLGMEELRASIARATGIGQEEVTGWPDMDFQTDVPQSACLSPTQEGEVEFGGLDPHHGVSQEIRMPRLSKSFDFQPELRHNPGPSPGLLLEAVTSAEAADGFDLERLEVLGDSFLKLVVTIDLFSSSTSEQEGLLTQMRARIICNRNLYRLGGFLRMGSMVAQEQFEPHRNWLPPGYCVPEDIEEMLMDTGFVYWAFKKDAKILLSLSRTLLTQLYQEYQADKERPDFVPPAQDTSGPIPICLSSQLPDKSVADAVEAIIGAYLLTTGPLGALKVMKSMGVKLCKVNDPGEEGEVEESRRLLGFPAPRTALLRYVDDPEGELSSRMSPWHGPMELAERTLGYTFRDRSFLLQACTHASYYRNRLTDCYQRLEFLGDAVIDYLVTRYLYEVPRTFRPGQLTDLRSSLVNNSFFAALVVRHGLHRCLLYCNPGLFSAVGRFVQHQERHRGEGDHPETSSDEDDDECGGGTMAAILDLNAKRDRVGDNPAYWKVLQRFYLHEEECEQPEEVEVPKALGDLFESLIGAVFLDCNMSLDTVWAILYRLFGREIESFIHRVPLPPIRALFERFPNAHFSQAEVLKNDRVKVELTVGEHTFTCVAKSKKTARTALAKKCLRMLRDPSKEAAAQPEKGDPGAAAPCPANLSLDSSLDGNATRRQW